MAKIFITGSSDGLGLLAANKLIDQGYEVILHARNISRKQDTIEATAGASEVLVADLSVTEDIKKLAEEVNSQGSFDAIIHNAGIYTASGEQLRQVNVLAPYLLTCLINPPKRLVYLSSGMHRGGLLDFPSLKSGAITYSDTKLYINLLSAAVARYWPDVYSNAVDPGWVPTKMGGSNAPDDLDKGAETQCWLAVSEDVQAKVTGKYFHHLHTEEGRSDAQDINNQEQFLKSCEALTGVGLPNNR
ncbi:SDR family NAD(P)-dependent oxidoreductase [Marinoscillum sp.]|uniref:SDR family NAD(P)-dependent oxidoreductase n=1 Tax=Marinoscillum sp. TaxID=2024838 RepID=UPI003BAABC7E